MERPERLQDDRIAKLGRCGLGVAGGRDASGRRELDAGRLEQRARAEVAVERREGPGRGSSGAPEAGERGRRAASAATADSILG